MKRGAHLIGPPHCICPCVTYLGPLIHLCESEPERPETHSLWKRNEYSAYKPVSKHTCHEMSRIAEY